MGDKGELRMSRGCCYFVWRDGGGMSRGLNRGSVFV